MTDCQHWHTWTYFR